MSTDFSTPEYMKRGKGRLWKDPAVLSIVRRMHEGDETLGWSGDKRLGLYIITEGPLAGGWAVVRHAEDGEEYTILVGKPGASLIELIPKLAEGDQRRRLALDINKMLDEEDRKREAKDQAQLDVAVDEFLRRSYESPSYRK